MKSPLLRTFNEPPVIAYEVRCETCKHMVRATLPMMPAYDYSTVTATAYAVFKLTQQPCGCAA